MGKGGIVKLFGNEASVKSVQTKLNNFMTAAWIWEGFHRHVKSVRGIDISNNILDKTATISTGLDICNCGHHIGKFSLNKYMYLFNINLGYS